MIKNTVNAMLTVRQVARLLNVHPNTVRRWSERGIIKACHISRRGDRRFDREEVASLPEELNTSKGNLEVVARIRGQVKIRVLIVDKQASFRNRLIHALSREPGLDLMDSEPGSEPMSLIETHVPEVLLLDVDQPSLSGLELGRRVLRHFPRTNDPSFTMTSNHTAVTRTAPAERVPHHFVPRHNIRETPP